ncbi:hypothetical protein RHMOL_Rhmol01G0125000 [Rhododendron molle]|uniref:Uncharacterized protein n=1 Tax=Rhododendron molle TaxID=49168 RepID=A0ACC0Q245_RHOML|nr:hypothetical protein RHMOL_Rhmol01G0125000 [Rhododendron molle]
MSRPASVLGEGYLLRWRIMNWALPGVFPAGCSSNDSFCIGFGRLILYTFWGFISCFLLFR